MFSKVRSYTCSCMSTCNTSSQLYVNFQGVAKLYKIDSKICHVCVELCDSPYICLPTNHYCTCNKFKGQ